MSFNAVFVQVLDITYVELFLTRKFLTKIKNVKVISVLGRKGRCERASIDEVYLDLTDAAEAMLLESPPEMLEKIDEEALKSHVLGLNEVLEKKL